MALEIANKNDTFVKKITNLSNKHKIILDKKPQKATIFIKIIR